MAGRCSIKDYHKSWVTGARGVLYDFGGTIIAIYAWGLGQALSN
jgi:hypothetical protein